MSDSRVTKLRTLEGEQVCIALADGTRVDDCQLVSVARHGMATIWIYSNGSDIFVPVGK